jgi:hypothetical protein
MSDTTEISFNKETMLDRALFNQTVYTPLPEAIKILSERRGNPELVKKISKLLNNNIPQIFKEKRCGIMARQLATPNLENRTFLSIAKTGGLHPIFLEYFDDKFTSNNKYKHSLGQLHIQNKIDKNGNKVVENITIIDFNESNGKRLKDIKTLWGESLIDFHKNLFKLYGLENFSFFEETDWYQKNNEKPIDFYTKFFLLVTCFGILFENFLPLEDNTEGKFTRDVVLPALKNATDLAGVKPLIVPVESIDSENDDFWYYHLPIIKKTIKNI